ncbi:hypothetical protein NNO_0456 [Hydrogenimonas sp.]|nr:hypothetical protein NNO_0456 [Hydrogenimonas sp.]
MLKKILMLKNLKLGRSFLFCVKNILKKNSYNILFYYPAHFNRSESKKNEFFEPLYEICDRHDISYLILEEPVLDRAVTRSDKAVPFDFIFLIILVLRKILPAKHFKDFYEKESYIADKIKNLLLRKLQYDNVIVLSNSMVGFFHGMDKNARIFDYQHGIIYPSHDGYISEEKRVPDHIYKNSVNLLLYSRLFKEILIEYTDSDYYKNHTYVIGKHIEKHERKVNPEKKNILFSLQIAGDEPKRDRNWVKVINRFLNRHSEFFTTNGLKIIFKRHPRYSPEYDDSSLYNFKFTELFDGTLDDALENCFIHITLFSTVVFDAAARGIPTLLWNTTDSKAFLYQEYYKYPIEPLDDDKIIGKISEYLEKPGRYENESEKVFDWFNYCYTPLKENTFFEALNLPEVAK